MNFADVNIIQFPDLGLGPYNLNEYLVENLFGVEALDITWYGFIICLGMICACAVILYNAVKREGFGFDSFLDYFIYTIPLGVVGARIMYVLARPDLYQSFSDVINIRSGGLAIYGGVIMGVIVILIVAKIKKQPVLRVFDAVVPGVLLAQAMGRWGNFVNGEAFGEVIQNDLPWGMIVNNHGPVHPTFFYESVITFTGFLISMFLLYRKKKFHGENLCFYMIWYGIGRTLVEGLRSDSLMLGDLRLSQCIGVASALGGVALLVILLLFRNNTAPEAEETVGEIPEETAGESEQPETREENAESGVENRETEEGQTQEKKEEV